MALIIFLAVVLGALGLYLMMPAEGRRPVVLGAVLAGAGLALLLVKMAELLGAQSHIPVYFYIFTAIALISAVRVITYRKPVHAALYFVMLVLAVAGLFVLLDAHFMAFATIIVYAGAILVTYLFVIMLATMPPGADQEGEEASPLYERVAREPLVSCAAGFALLAVILGLTFADQGANATQPAAPANQERILLAGEYGPIVTYLRDKEVIKPDDHVKVTVADPSDPENTAITAQLLEKEGKWWPVVIPDDVQNGIRRNAHVGNTELLGLTLFRKFSLGIELAGVILLLSMVGAVVIARKRIPAPTPAVEA